MSNFSDRNVVHLQNEHDVDPFYTSSPSRGSSRYSPTSETSEGPELTTRQTLTNLASNTIVPYQTLQREFDFDVTEAPPSRFQLQPYQNQSTHSMSSHHPTIVFFCPKNEDKNVNDHDENDVTDELINRLNARVGHSSDKKYALGLIEKMRRLGGLDEMISGESIEVDIPAARKGLSILIGLDENTNKIYALKSLLTILREDRYHKSTAVNLIPLAAKILEQLDKDIMQAQTVDDQILIAEVYSELAECMHHHYGKRHINAITMELKTQLINTTQALRRLNIQEDFKLKFQIKCALEGFRRLRDDRQELFIMLERIYHAAAAATCFVMEDSLTGFTHLEMIFKDINPQEPDAWYKGVLMLKNMAKGIESDQSKLTGVQMLIKSKFRSFNWKFSYAAIYILSKACMNGETAAIRSQAFFGLRQNGLDLPGLKSFVAIENLPSFLDMGPLKRREMPRNVDQNSRARLLCAELLYEIADRAPDEKIRIEAQWLINIRKKIEQEPLILDILNRGLNRLDSNANFPLDN